MKRFFAPVTTEAATKKPRRVFNPTIETFPSISPTSSTIEVSSITPQSTSSSNDKVYLLNQSQQETAKCCVYNEWLEIPGILTKLRTRSTQGKLLKGVIAFDLDGTIITTKSGKKFPVSEDDWKFWHPSVPEILQLKSSEGYLLAFLSNQGGLEKKTENAGFKRKVDAIIERIGVPIDFICSLQKDVYRKPCTGMWEFLSIALWEKHFENSATNKIEYLYVGDAAGRPASGTRSKDFSDTDLKLAINLGIEFQTPEKFFLNSTQSIHTSISISNAFPSMRLSDWANNESAVSWELMLQEMASSTNHKEIILLVAPPACGKSTLARAFASQYGYFRINQDELGTIQKCMQVAKENILLGKSLVIDNTNLNKNTRLQWIAFAKEFNYQIRCINIKLSKDLCMLLSTYRLLNPFTLPQDRRKIETVVFHKFYKELEFPTLSEGYDRVDSIGWIPQLPINSASSPISYDATETISSRLVHRLYTMYIK